MAVRMQQRRGTSAQWTMSNPVLKAGEIGFETNTSKMKVGDGSTAWNSLAYVGSPGDATSAASSASAAATSASNAATSASAASTSATNASTSATNAASSATAAAASATAASDIANSQLVLTAQFYA